MVNRFLQILLFVWALAAIAATWAYDALQRLTNETAVGVYVNSFGYARAGDLRELVDGEGHLTSWGYDGEGLRASKTNHLNVKVAGFDYDANGRLTNRWTVGKGATSYSYDGVGNLTLVNYPVSPDVTLQYDALNRLTNMVDAAGTTRFGYSSGLLASEDGPWSADTVSYGYTAGRRGSLSMQQPGAGAWAQGYDYDAAGRLTNIVSPAGVFSYLLGGGSSASALIKRLTFPNSAYITNTFDTVGRLAGTLLMKNEAEAVLNSHAYLVNEGNQRYQQTFKDGNYIDYTYDDIGQLRTALGKEAGGAVERHHEQFGYAYDAAGNLESRTNYLLIQEFEVDARNRLTAVTMEETVDNTNTLTISGATSKSVDTVKVNGILMYRYADNSWARRGFALPDGPMTYTVVATESSGATDTSIVSVNLPNLVSYNYDANGNLTGDGLRSFVYDDENQLTRVTVANVSSSGFVYDGFGRMRIRYESNWIGSAWSKVAEVRYVYDGRLPIQERDANNNVLVTYTRGRDLSGTLEGAGGIGGLLARSQPSHPTAPHAFYHADGSGNITALINQNQQVVARYNYSPFGSVINQSGYLADANTYRFSSKEYHAPSGLSYYLRRFYDPSLQRWVNEDPIGEAGGINLYGFVHNRPSNSVDPFGKSDFNRPPQSVSMAPGGLQALYGPPRPEPTGRLPAGPNAGDYAGFGAGLAASMIPGVGEQMDMNVINDPSAPWWQKGMSGLSLCANLATGGMAPNAGAMLKSGRKLPLWSSTKSKSASENAFDHWRKHGPEFPQAENAKGYVDAAKKLFAEPPPGTLTKTRPNGDRLFYDPVSNTFGVQAADGAPRTMFCPKDGINYWNKQ